MQIVDYVTDNIDRFKELLNLLLTAPKKVSERSSWPLSYCAERCPDWIHPHIGKVLRIMEESDPTAGTRRNRSREKNPGSILTPAEAAAGLIRRCCPEGP